MCIVLKFVFLFTSQCKPCLKNSICLEAKLKYLIIVAQNYELFFKMKLSLNTEICELKSRVAEYCQLKFQPKWDVECRGVMDVSVEVLGSARVFHLKNDEHHRLLFFFQSRLL